MVVPVLITSCQVSLKPNRGPVISHTPIVFAAVTIGVWLITGPLFGFSDTWQLVINTGTTIVTFLMVFLIQNTQNRDSAAVHLKLDELIRTVSGAHNALLDLRSEERRVGKE